MADINELFTALQRADSAGNTEDAKAIAEIIRQLQEPAPKQSAFRQIADIPVGVAKGVVSGIGMVANAFGAGSETAKTIKGVEDYLGGLMSAQAQNDQQKIAQIMQEAEDKGVGEQVKAAIKSFLVAPVDMLSNALGTTAPVIVAGLAAKVLGPAAIVASGVGMGGTMGAGVVKGTIYDETKRALLEAGTSPEQAEARAQLAQSYGGKNLDMILSGVAIGSLAATTGVERAIVRPLAQNILKKSAAGRTEAVVKPSILGTAAAEAIPETAQGAQERLAQNIALQREGFEVPTMRGVVGAGALEGIVGGGLGAGVGALSGAPQTQVQPQQPGQPTQQPPEAPITPTTPIPTTAQEPLFREPSPAPEETPPLEGMAPSGQFTQAPREVLGAESELATDQAAAQLEMQQAELQQTKGILEREIARAPTAAEKVTLQYQLRDINTQLGQVQKQLRRMGVTEPTKRERADFAQMQPELDLAEPAPVSFEIDDQKLTDLGFAKTSKRARTQLKEAGDISTPEGLEAFETLIEQYRAESERLKAEGKKDLTPRFNYERAREFIDQAKERVAEVQPAPQAQPAPIQPTPEPMAAQPAPQAQPTPIQPTPEPMAAQPAPQAQPAPIQPTPEPMAAQPAPQAQPAPIQPTPEPMAAQPAVEPTPFEPEGAPDVTGREAVEPSVVAPVPQPAPGERAAGVTGPAGVVSDTGDVGPRDGREEVQQPALSAKDRKRLNKIDAALRKSYTPEEAKNTIKDAIDPITGKVDFDYLDSFLKLKGPQVGAALPNTVTSKLQAGDLKGALRTLGETGSTPIIRTIARKLLPAIRKTNIVNQAAPDGSPAIYDRATDTIYLDPSVYSEHALLHESAHAAISHVLDNKLHPLTQKLQKLFDALTPDIKNTYGATNLQEFAAESISNQEFQSLMRGQPKNWWSRFVDAVRGFLGLSKAKQVEKTLDQILEVAPMEARGGVDGMLGMNFEQKSDYAFNPSSYRQSVVSWAKERFGDMVAPNGKPAWQNFVKWFGDSKVVDADGNPLVVYHGTRADVSEFKPSRIGAMGPGVYFATSATNAAEYAGVTTRKGQESGADTVYPVYLSVKNPFRISSVDKSSEELFNTVDPTGKLSDGEVAGRLQEMGYDGVWAEREGEIVVFRPEQIKSAVGNEGAFDPAKPQLLRLDTTAPQTFEGKMKKIIADAPEPKALATRAFDKVMSALDSAYPAQEAMRKAMRAAGRTANEIAIALGVFAQAGHLNAAAAQGAKIGGVRYDADVGNFVAERSKYSFDEINKAKDNMASRYGLSNQEVTKIVDDWLEADRLLGIYRERDDGLNKAAKWAAAGNKKEAKKLRDKWEDMPFHMSREDAQRNVDMAKQYPELKQIKELKNGLREWTVKFLTDMGVISKERGEIWLDNAEWIPFQREFDPDETASMDQFARHRMGIQAAVKNPKYKGSTRPVEPVLENFEKWIMHSLRMGMREGFTKAAVAEAIKSGQAKPDNMKETRGTENRRVKYHVNGQPRYALFDNPEVAAFYNSNVVPPKVSGLLSGFNSLFRKSIVGLPTFALKQLIVDSLEAIQKSGLPPRYAISIPIKAAKEFYKLTFKGPTETYQKLMDRGFAGPFTDIGAVRSEELKQLGYGIKDETQRNMFMGALHKAELMGMRAAMHSDNAVRAAIFQASQEAGMSQAQSYTMAADYINFRRQVNNDALRMYVAYVPFAGASMSALRSSLMALSGKGLTQQERNQALKNYAANMALLTTISVLLAMANEDDEAYKNMSPEQRARQLTIPGAGGLGIPRRVSIESLFPIMAELMTNQATSNAVDSTQLRRTLAGLGVEALAPVPMPMPAPIKTGIEQATNYNFFTGEPIVSYGMSKREAWMQYGASTSSLARGIGELLNEARMGDTPFASPARIDHVIRGLLGSVGSGMLLLSNFVAGKVGDRPGMTTNEILTSIPGFTMPAAREFNQADRTAFYDMAERMSKVASTANALLEQGKIEEYQAYVEKNANKIGMNKVANKIMPQLNAIRKELNRIRESDMPNKDEEIRRLRQIEMNVIRSLNVPELRKMAGL